MIALVLILLVTWAATARAGECPGLGALSRNGLVLGGYSFPRQPTEDEVHKLKNLWAREALQKCSGVPQDFDKIKVCSVRVQVVNGVNVEYLLKSTEKDDDTTIRLQAHFPGSWSVGESQRITSCQVTPQW